MGCLLTCFEKEHNEELEIYNNYEYRYEYSSDSDTDNYYTRTLLLKTYD